MGSRKKTTVGYRYSLGMHDVFCQGPIDNISIIYFDEDVAWSGLWTTGSIYIDKTDLFGGDDKEGGVKGTFDLIIGNSLALNPYMVAQLGAEKVSAYYGVTSIVMQSPYLGNSPYIKPMSVVAQSGEWQWPGMPQWYISAAKVPWNAVYGGGGTISDEWDDDDIRAGMDVWIVFCGNVKTDDGNDLIPMAEAVRAVVNERLNALDDPASKQIHLGIAFGGKTTKLFSRDEPASSFQNSAFVEGATDNPSSWAYWSSYNLPANATIKVSATFGGILNLSGSKGSGKEGEGKGYMLSAANNMGREYTPRTTKYRNGVVIYLGDNITASDMAVVRDRFLGTAGGSFQFHRMRPKDFRRKKAPYDFPRRRMRDRVVSILQNEFPGGSTSEGFAFTDGINLDSPAADSERPSQQGYDLNPVHILRECIISPIIGLGEPESMVDAAKATYAADLLYNEGFGISLKWSEEGPVEEFMQLVCDHANITTYVSNRTGLWVIKPIRGDYDPDTIPTLDEEDILEIESITRRLPSEGVNAVTVKYHDLDRNDTTTIPVYNTAGIQMRGGAIDATTVFYDGILREDLAYAVGERDLLTLGYPIVTGAIYLDRQFHYYEPGDVFWLNAPKRGVLNEIMRVVDVDYGNDEEMRIRIDLTSDIYSLEPQPMDRGEPYTPPVISQPPVPVIRRYVEEASYFLASLEMGKPTLDASLLSDQDAGGIYVGAPSPASSIGSAQVWASLHDAENYIQNLTMEFAPAVTIIDGLTASPLDETFDYDVAYNPSSIFVGDLAVIESEFVRVKAINTLTKTMTVARGVFDTVPVEHPDSALLLMVEGFGGFAEGNYTALMDFDVKLLPYSGNKVLPLADAEPDYVMLNSRLIRPYPAADLKVGGTYNYEFADWTGSHVLTWVHRNRLQQTNLLAGYTEAGLTPEAGLTYIFRVKAWRLDGTALADVANINIGLVATYTADLSLYAIPPAAAKMAVQIVAVRDGYECWTNVEVYYVVPYSLSMGFDTTWWDANIPESMAQQVTNSGVVDSDGDEVRRLNDTTVPLPVIVP